MNEWKHGSFEEELKKGDGDERSSVPYEVGASAYRSTTACSILKVHWFRLIVDEGHSMGRGSNNSTILFASWVMAQRRWVMTGTPTPQTLSHSGLTNLLGLMRFLQHDFFSAHLEGDRIWQGSIARSWNNGNLSGFFRLRELMALLMVRHTKLDIEELQPPRFRRTFSTMSTEEIKAYNALVCALQANLLITSMEGETSGRQDSILFRSNAKLAREAFNNLRLVCCGRWDVVPTIENDLFQETIDMLRALGLADFRIKVVENYIHRAITDQLSSCNLCGLQLSTLLIVPCGHLICTECMDSETTSCAVCEEPFNIDTFQRVQPGIALTWHESREKEKMKKKVVSIEAGTGEESSLAQAMNIAERVAIQPPPVRRRTRRFGDGHVCEYDVASPEGKCTLCFEEHSECVMVDRSRCRVCFKTSETCPEEESKAFYLSKKLKERHSEYAGSVGQHFDPRTSRILEKRPLKVIVFSEFQKTMNQVGNRLLREFGSGCVAEFWGQTRALELSKFAKSPDCFCMLLGKAGSEGLDLSFVTHIFFLEEVWDKSLENQAISRAWRMGAKGHVEVETIAARGTVEETMMGVEQALTSTTRVSSETSNASKISAQKKELSSVKEYQRAKLLFLLQNLKLIRPHRADETSTVSNNAKRLREVSNVGEDTEAPKKLPRVQFHESTVGDDTEAPKKRPRVRFHESTETDSSSLDREHGVSVSFASRRPLGAETKARKTEAS
jgi:SNF2 family DNA or RNA helicase